jgi:hypothetical protein
MLRPLAPLARLTAALVLATLAALLPRDAWAGCAPTARLLLPASGVVGTSVTATVTGTGLSGATASVFGEPGLGVNVTNTSDTSVTLQLQIDAAATPGERIISLTTPEGAVAVDFTVNPAGGPVVSGVTPVPLATQGFALHLSFTGQNLSGLGVANIAVTGTGVTVADAFAEPDGSRLDVSLSVAADADVGTHALVLSSPLGGAVVGVYVQRPAPVLTKVSPGAGEIGTVVPLTITGTNLTGATLVIGSGASGQGGVVISDIATPDDQTLTATLTISSSLSGENEPRLLIVTSESGQATEEFFVVTAGVPSITSLRPGAGEPGVTTSVTIRGLNLTGATLSEASANLSLQNVSVVDDETITADVSVTGNATTNTNHTITATVGMASATATFRVIPANSPFIGAVRPPFGNRGSSFSVLLDGVNLSNVTPGTGVTMSGSKVSVTNATAVDSRTVRAQVDLNETASVGFRDVTVTTSSGAYTKSASFRVNIPGQVPILTDLTPSVVDPGTTTTITVTGSGFLGAGVTVGGPGVTVSHIVVDPTGSSLTFDLTLAPDAPAESRPVLVVTENGIARCVVTSGADIELTAATLLRTGSAFEVPSSGFRLFLFEFSINDRFEPGLRTLGVASAAPRLVLTRLQAENVARAVRDLPLGYVRVRAVTATNQIGISAPARFRR